MTRQESIDSRVTVDGVTRTVGEWAELNGIPLQTVLNRIHAHRWDRIRAVTTPFRGNSAHRHRPWPLPGAAEVAEARRLFERSEARRKGDG